jgi:hypothetical protein
MSIRASIVVAALLAACGSSSQTPPPASPPPSGTWTASSPIGRDCGSFADYRRDHCEANRAAVLEQCQVLARLAEAARCVLQAKRSYDCGLASETACSTATCCHDSISQCDEPDVAFDHCIRGYCSGHGGNPDCKTFDGWFGDDTPDAPAAPPSPSGAPVPQPLT